MNYKSCGNCGADKRFCTYCIAIDRELWRPIPCPLCGGTLSEIRTDGKRKWRHCYSCHFEFKEGE